MNDSSPTSQVKYSEELGIVAPAIGWTPPIRYLLRRARILSLLKETSPSTKLLEIGCGAGALLCDLARRGYSAQGLETSSRALVMASQLARAAQSTHDISPIPHADWSGNFDVICAFDVLEHIEDDYAAIEEWLHWLRPQGKIVLSVPAHRSRWGSGDAWAGHWRRYDRNDIRKLIIDCGLKIDHFECYGFPLANATEALGNLIYSRMLIERKTDSKSEATAASGIDRRNYLRISRWTHSLPGRALIAVASGAQYVTRNRNWGSGYLVMASRR
ncbi:class I SAM-dependent methyltransferase [Stenotrophomonas sp. SY1]|uniref:class I SAM-dependent methyltransferase n=1 Tax=Stenotrophomonas sp. SY1 TaxID=477235 RepID=UPI001E40C7B8|nr:class I SAM-dependent methyltransferase [Stenotrophomonas sp. SY1]MCD9086159.1 methyltransferase domain-containing protein [Stenotrophomonas sp. SY1]